MTATLTAKRVGRYEADGYLAPIRVLGDEETARFRAAYDGYERSLGDKLETVPAKDQYVFLAETHTFLRWAYELASHPSVLDAVESILGPDLLIWDSRWFTKRPGDRTYVSWHQDGTYWALDPPKACTAWIALSRSFPGNGAMQVVPGSHLGEQLPHRDTLADDNALARGQEIAVEVDEAGAISLTLEPGEMSIHHVGIVHGSKPNTSGDPRIGLAVRFISPEVRQEAESTIAMLVRGEDRYGHFELLEPPADGTPEKLEARRAEVIGRMYRNLLPED